MLKIVVLDGYTLNPGDISWDPLQELGELVVYERSAEQDIFQRAQDANILLTNKTSLSRKIIFNLPALQYIGILATGYNVVDIQAARERGIPVCNVPDYSTQAVAQMTFAHLLNLTNQVASHGRGVRKGRWAESADFCYWDYPQIELSGLLLGIVGLGRIGQAVAKIALSFGLQVWASVRSVSREVPFGIQLASLEELFSRCDIVSLHCPLTEENREFVNWSLLSLMKKTAFLLNTSRGPLINEQDLAQALNQERIAGAGLDVLSVEPPEKDNPLFKARNCFITPHIAWASHAARQRLLTVARDNILGFLTGKLQNVVN